MATVSHITRNKQRNVIHMYVSILLCDAGNHFDLVPYDSYDVMCSVLHSGCYWSVFYVCKWNGNMFRK
jgi:hypothetical protein